MSNPDEFASTKDLRAEIHAITVKGSKSLTSVDLLIGRDAHIAVWMKNGDTLRTTLDPPCNLSNVSSFTLRLHYRLFRTPLKRPKDVSVDVQKHLSESGLESGGKREWRQVHGKAEITITVQLMNNKESVPSTAGATDLSSTTQSILSICPRFRILVIGKSGAGKSSLINAVFGVEKAKVSHRNPGEARIEEELTSEQNDRLILHDSQGFEAGEADTVEIVDRFIKKKTDQPYIKDKLHAVWLCLEIPCAGGRMMETGVEKFIESKTTLSNIPVIAVFTKYDALIKLADYEMDPKHLKGLSDEEISTAVRREAEKKLQEVCIGPFEECAQGKLPHVTVSTKKQYEDTVDKLVKLTFSEVEKHVASEPSAVTAAMAQKASPSVKISASITVGKTKYWKGLASGTNFMGQSLKACLEVIHVDIVAVWNFDDPHGYLQSTEFHGFMYDLIHNLADDKSINPNHTLSVGLSMVGTIAGIISALSGPAAPIVVPIVAAAVLSVWLYQVYQQSNGTLRRLMAYIVNLTLVMQNVFWLRLAIPEVDRPPNITRRLIKLAFKTYKESVPKAEVHREISNYVKQAGVLDRRRDGVLEKIEELIDRNRIEAADMHLLKSRIGDIDLSGEDESW